jgi:hypothetical protein
MKESPQLQKLDQKIEQWSHTSSQAPQPFLEAECRREINRCLIIPPPIRRLDDALLDKFFPDHFFQQVLQDLEGEYLCYFAPEQFAEKVQEDWRGTLEWKYVYGGCSAQIEGFLKENGLEEVMEKLGVGETFHPVQEIRKKDIPEGIRRYFIGIGYLYPEQEKLLVHPNLLMAQRTRFRYSVDSPFLSRDLIRCPYHEAYDGWGNPPLTDQELWQYWSDLVGLSLAGLPEAKLYFPKDLRNKHDRDYHMIDIGDRHRPLLRLGKQLVPQRYIEVQQRIEQFSWIFPESVVQAFQASPKD